MWGTQNWCKILQWLFYCFANCDSCCQKRFVPVRQLHYRHFCTQSLRYAIPVLIRHLLWVRVLHLPAPIMVWFLCPPSYVSLPAFMQSHICLSATLPACLIRTYSLFALSRTNLTPSLPCMSRSDLTPVCIVSYYLNPWFALSRADLPL